jgi:hypothetical protein
MKKFCIQTLMVLLLAGILPFFSWTSARAEEMSCPTHTLVSIDIKPGSFPNRINLSSNGLVPVAVLATQDFDASHFMPEMAHLYDSNTAMSQMCAGAFAVRWKLDDVNRDGKLDLVFFFSTTELNLTLSSTNATFMAHGSYDSTVWHIIGTDSVQVKP